MNSGFFHLFGAEPFFLLVLALLLELLAGDPPFLYWALPNPLDLWRRFVGFLARKLNRKKRSPDALFLRGLFLLLVLILLSWYVGKALAIFLTQIPYSWALEIILLMTIFSQKKSIHAVRVVEKALGEKGTNVAANLIHQITGLSADKLDSHGQARLMIEYAAEQMLYRLIAPSLVYLCFGWPGMLAYLSLRALVHAKLDQTGYDLAPGKNFFLSIVKLDHVVNYIPARLATVFTMMAAWLMPGLSMKKANEILQKTKTIHFDPNAGLIEASFAGAMDLALGGPQRGGYHLPGTPWIGTGRARATPGDLRKTAWVYLNVSLLQIAFLVLAGMLWLQWVSA